MTEHAEHEHDPLALESELPSSPMTVNLGPSHPAMHGTVRLVVTLDGETIVEAVPEIGFLHRGFSKSSENSTWTQVLPYTDRLNYVSPYLNNVAYVMGVEKLIGLKVPERAEYIRVLTGEISRITDHLTCIGAIGLELGAFTVFLYAIEARELLWDRISELSGARVTVSWMRVGGCANDIPPGWVEKLRECMPRVVELTNEIDVLLTRNRIFVDRTRDIGAIGADEAIDWGFTGPCLRACGVNYDVRKAHPYSVYDRLDFEVPLGSKGDTYDRYVLRLEEIRQSHRIIDQCLEQMPPGPIIVDDWRYALPPKKDVFSSIEGVMAHFKLIMEGIQVPPGEVYAYCEGANGELGFHIVSNGKGKPYTIQVRAPGFPILSALPRLIKGHAVADIIPIFDSINMIGGEVEQ
jgi:NADH-quinone oxidoreductase subunit D